MAKLSSRQRLLNIAEKLLALPTAPFREQHIQKFITDFCTARNISVTRDKMGNLIATYGRQYKNPTFYFAAHMDHPGFIIEKDSQRNRTTALFYGGVDNEYFKTAAVRIFTESGPVKAKITKLQPDKKKRYKRVYLHTNAPVKKGCIAMWDITPFKVKGDKLYSRACDDLVGCVSVLAMLDQLHLRRIRKKVAAVFTVAEEAGLHGAKYICTKKTVPKDAYIVAIETSGVLPCAKMGDGTVVRVGDALSIFTPQITAFLTKIAKKTKAKNKNFKYQRKLMDAGTCESSIYNAFGYTNAAVCIPLGNYHNRNFKTKKIAPEYVSVDDLHNMVELFLALVRNCKDLPGFIKPKKTKYKIEKRPLGEMLLNR